METAKDEERLPDPFEVGDDEELTDEEITPAAVPPTNREEVAQRPPLIERQSDTPSNFYHNVPPVRPIGTTPSPPPKDDTPKYLIGGVPTLLYPNLFLPIPDSDPLTMLLAKYVPNPDHRPRRDLSGDFTQSDLNTLIMTNSWRATAKLARHMLLSTSPTDVEKVLELWSLRLNSLARLRLYNQASAECTALFHAISAINPPESREYLLQELLPLDLELCRARLRYWTNDHTKYVDELMQIVKRCRAQAQKYNQQDEERTHKWLDRAARVSVVLASQLVEMKQFTTATRLLESIVSSAPPELRSTLAMIYLQIGDFTSASRHFDLLEKDEKVDIELRRSTGILKQAFLGEWDNAIELLRARRESLDGEENPMQRITDANNLAVAYLNVGRLGEGIAILEDAFKTAPSIAVVAEALIFNLATMYELQSTTAMDRKIGMLLQVSQWSGDGLRHTALKLG
ncbi:hypothetical protein CPB86DRAFT_25683 [Serendipita vermifera]|nr:hypothetical protein CPB86DRAFT_25683 [Serendipita vermifera]